ncbi:MFS transporter [Halobacillus kuroshimensis]|uniref:MFS transporter n=1 Tax=Halobacillus kuroshimensis TaxID=302481 RepID=A0ABS3DXV1_9BACI|nr:MFS transporter [Halobacillus kuroshimensis]MBN8236188.1 MFS transporter [Halobacillus kuroshimensis]
MQTSKAEARKNVWVMWFANFFIAGSITMVLPFLSLYIETFGNFSDAYVQTWSGWVFGVTFVTAFICSPIWGKIGDRYGRKKILVMSALGLALSVYFMGHATSVWQLFFLRLFMGVFTGFIPMSQALISTQTPKEMAGRVLGTLQTGSITGSLLGPLLGGWIADSIGYAATFQYVSFAVALSAIIVFLGVHEQQVQKESEGEKSSYNTKEVLSHIVHHPLLLMVMVVSLFVQIAHFSIQPILSLFVGELHGPENLALFSGIAFSAAGLGNLMMARRWGEIADRVGYIKILIFLLIMAGVVYLPAAFVTNIWELVLLRFLLGVSIGGIIPVRTAYIRQEAPVAMQGEVLGYNTSLRFLGNIIGPAMGGMVAGAYGFSMVFFVTSGLLLLSGGMLFLVLRRRKPVFNHASSH